MPTTYTPLATTTLTSSGTVTFSSISSAYTDLVIVISGRSVRANTTDGLAIRFNSDSGNNYSATNLRGDGNVAQSSRYTNESFMRFENYATTAANSPANTFGATILHFQNYSNTTTFKTVLARQNNASAGTETTVGLWRSTAAINSISFLALNANYDVGSTFSLYGVASAAVVSGAKATGGDVIATDGTYWYHAFLASGTFTPTQALTCDLLVVAGGGGGGGGSGGGGGAGGYQLFSSQSISASAQTVTIGAGGGGGTGAGSTGLTNGSNSQFASLTASVGGGRGGSVNGSAQPSSGGSGGGQVFGGQSGGAGTAGQGNKGGDAGNSGAGGGGAGAAGSNSVSINGGAGGAGKNSESSWLTVTGLGVSGFIAGGGGGGGNAGGTAGAAGSGGASAGTVTGNASNATANTGSGGGGGAYNGAPFNGGNGGSGLVIVRYAV